jgi:hypothetical protein
MFNNLAITITTFLTTFGLSFLYFKENFFEILVVVEFLIILILAFMLYKSQNNEMPINIKAISNKTLFKIFFEKEKNIANSNIEQLANGYMELFGENVKYMQSNIIKYIMKTDKKYIKTLDITSNPARWLTRKQYIQANKDFVESGGMIQRVLIIENKETSNKTFMEDLFKLITIFENNGIQLGLQFDSLLTTDELKDFIVYGDFSVLTEGRQADENYKKASSTINFNDIHLKKHMEIFENVWSKSDTSPSSVDILRKFKLFYENKIEYTEELFSKFIKENYNEY